MARLRDNRYSMHRSTAILSLTTAALAATAFWLWRDREQALTRLESSQAGQEALERRAPAVDPSIAAVASPATTMVGQPEAGGGTPEKAEDHLEFQRRLFSDPAYREARRHFRQLELISGHLDLAKALGIPSEKAKQLIAFLVDQEFQYMDRGHFNPRTEEEARIRTLQVEQAVQEQDAELVAMLGERKFAEWKEYQASLQVRHEVRALGASLFAQGAPLREEQIELLISAIQAERARARQKLVEFTESLVWSGGAEVKSHRYRDKREVELSAEMTERVHDVASGILSKQQLAVLDDYLQRRLELEDAQHRMHEAQADWMRVNAEDD